MPLAIPLLLLNKWRLIECFAAYGYPECDRVSLQCCWCAVQTGSSLSFHNMSRGGPPSEGASNERKPVQEMSIKDIKEKNEVMSSLFPEPRRYCSPVAAFRFLRCLFFCPCTFIFSAAPVSPQPGTYAFIAQVRRIYWKPRQQQQQSEQPQQDIYAYAACPTCRKKLHEDAANEYSCYPCNTSHVGCRPS